MVSRETSGTGRVAMRCLSLADGTPGPAGQYLKRYDPRTGESEWTADFSEALQLPAAEAVALWRSVHPTQPIRPWDGKPNRPLTAFTVEFLPLDKEDQ